MFAPAESSNYISPWHLYFPLDENPLAPPPTPDDEFVDAKTPSSPSVSDGPTKAVPLRDRKIEWPIVKSPVDAPDLCRSVEFSTGEALSGRTAKIAKSFSSGILQYASDIRDQILSDPDTTAVVKLTSVISLTIVSTLTFQVSNIVEIWMRSFSFLVCSIFMCFEIPDILNAKLGTSVDIYETTSRDPMSDHCYMLFTSAVYGMMQTTGGFVHAYHLLTNTKENMPHITKITDQATFGIQSMFTEYFDDTVLPMIAKLCEVKLA